MSWKAIISATVAALALAVISVPVASAHRNPCHTRNECPSDHATYRWKGWLCVSPTADERTAKFKKRIVYGGRTYFCHR